MCTAICVGTKQRYFGRNLDIECSYGEKIIITPRGYDFAFENTFNSKNNAIIGIGTAVNDYPLYYDAVNERGLCMAALRYPGVVYNEIDRNKINVASYELIPYILRICDTVEEAREILSKINITNKAFSDELPPSPLHWIISDKKESLTLEVNNGRQDLYCNQVEVLTNMPAFKYQIFNLNNYINLTAEHAVNRFSKEINLNEYSRGMGAIGLPGDLSSMSRFVRAVFTKYNSKFTDNEQKNITQFFHILYSVYQQKGCAMTEDGKLEHTLYSSCCDINKGVYYYTTYSNFRINAVYMHNENLESDKLINYLMITEPSVNIQN